MDSVPPAPAAAPEKVLVYDGDCAMCEAASRRIVAWTRLPESARASHLTFEGETAARLDAAGIRNEMAVISPATGEIRSGLPAILWFLRGTRWGWLASILDHAVLRGPLTVYYRFIAYNRRIIAPVPPRAFACACDPDPSPVYNAAFTSWLAAGAACGAGAAAAYVLHAARIPAAYALLVVGIVLLGLAVVAALTPPGRRVAAHVAWVVAVAGLPSLMALPFAFVLAVSALDLPGPADSWWLPSWFVVAPALGLVMGAISLRRRWHLVR
jgi:predicted DCC family thiol-disulfide oxidoreductase YuxK